MPPPTITAVHLNPGHTFSKLPQTSIHLLAGRGVEGDAHCGATVRHRYLVRRNPAAPNLTQIHLLAHELLDELGLAPGQLGENLTTQHLDLLTLPLATRLLLGSDAIVQLTGLRTPCFQLDKLRPGLMKACFTPGTRHPRVGIMAIVLATGTVYPEDLIRVELPPAPHRPLRPV